MPELPLPPPGFRGLDLDQRIRVYRRHLPHWRQDGATYFVTFRLSDTLPESKLAELKSLRSHWEHTHPEPRSDADWEEYAREYTRRAEAWLDEGHGACYFRERRRADELRERLHHLHGQRYQLSCWVIMPNHCHIVIRPFDGEDLEDSLGAFKSITARLINDAVERTGDLWQQECFDRIIRDAEHLHRVIQYIGRNPANAGLPPTAWRRWIDPAWQAAGWDFGA